MNVMGTPKMCSYRNCTEPAKAKTYTEGKYTYYCTQHAEEVLRRIVGERKKK